MKKIFILLMLVAFTSTLYVAAASFSFSDSGMNLDADIDRQGNFIKIHYKFDGINNTGDTTVLTEEQSAALATLSNARFDILASCKEPKIKILSMDVYDLNGELVNQVSNSDWIALTKTDDIQKLKELCRKY